MIDSYITMLFSVVGFIIAYDILTSLRDIKTTMNEIKQLLINRD